MIRPLFSSLTLIVAFFSIFPSYAGSDLLYGNILNEASVSNGEISNTEVLPEKFKSALKKEYELFRVSNVEQKRKDIIVGRRNEWGYTEIQIPMNVSNKELGKDFCYILSPSGIYSVIYKKMVGIVVLEDTSSQNRYYGTSISKLAKTDEKLTGGFIFCSKKALTFSLSSSSLDSEIIKKSFVNSSKHFLRQLVEVDSAQFWEITNQYQFKAMGLPEYIFFQLAPDDRCELACCHNRYFLIDSKNYSITSTILSGCDA